MGQAGGLGQAVATAACHHPENRRFEVAPMAYRDVDGFHSPSGAQGGAYNITVFGYFGMAARFGVYRLLKH